MGLVWSRSVCWVWLGQLNGKHMIARYILVERQILVYSWTMTARIYDEYLERALMAGCARDYAKAETLLARIVAETDSIPQAWLWLGRARHAAGHAPKAIPVYIAYLERAPEDPAGWFFLGRSYLASGLNRSAWRCLKKANDLGRQDAETLSLLGFAALRLKKPAVARRYLESALSLAPDNRRIFRAYLNALFIEALHVLRQGDPETAAHMIGFVQGNGLDRPVQHLYRAKALRIAGRLAEALAELQLAMIQVPHDTSLRLQAAAIKLMLGDTGEALAELSAAGIQASPPRGAALSPQAVVRIRILAALKTADYQSALAAAIECIRSGDTDPALRAVAAQANFELKHYDRALAHYQRGIEADPASPELRLGLALSLWELQRYQDAQVAIRAAAARGAAADDCEYVELLCTAKLAGSTPESIIGRTARLLESRRGDKRLMYVYAENLYKNQQPELAELWFSALLELTPHHESCMLYRIAIAESLGNQAAICQRYDEYLASFPDNAKLRHEYVTLLVSSQHWETAVQVIESGYAYERASRNLDCTLALCYRKCGKYKDAAVLYRKLLIQTPKDPELLMNLVWCIDRMGTKAVAMELLERGARWIGTDPALFMALGIFKARRNENEQAADAFAQAAELAPADPRPLRHLERLYRQSGVLDMAERYASRAAELEARISRRTVNARGRTQG
jgi:tetratricopeptide (TPR) repeat protein